MLALYGTSVQNRMQNCKLMEEAHDIPGTPGRIFDIGDTFVSIGIFFLGHF